MFWGITIFFEKWTWYQPSTDFEMKKKRAFSRKVRGSYNKNSRFQRNFMRKKIFLFRKSFIFLLSFFKLEWFLCLFANSFSQVCQTTNQREERKKIGEIKLEKLCASNNFGLWDEKTWSFSKTVKHDSQNRSLHEQMNNFRKFYGSKNIGMKVFGHWTEILDFWRKLLLRVAKGAIQVSSATFQKKMINVKFTVCGFFRTLCDFFCSDRKSGTQCQNQKICVQSKNVGRIFLTRMFFETFSDFEQKNLGN